MGRKRNGFGHVQWLKRLELYSEFLPPVFQELRKFHAARWLLAKLFSMTTVLFVILGAWMLLSLIFCLALCVAASKPVPEFEATEESFKISHQHADHDHVLLVNGFGQSAAAAKRASENRYLPSTLTNASKSF